MERGMPSNEAGYVRRNIRSNHRKICQCRTGDTRLGEGIHREIPQGAFRKKNLPGPYGGNQVQPEHDEDSAEDGQ